jgi:Lipocalin-like domain
MNGCAYRIRVACLAAGAMLAGLLSLPGSSVAQSLKEQIVGTWRLVSIYNEENGAKTYNFGEKPLGLLIFDRSGNVINFLSKPGLPKFAVDNRLKGTDAEYRAVMQGLTAGFGTYTVDGDTATITWVASRYPNRAGTTEKRTYKIVGDEMTATNPTASSGGTAFSSYTRAK